MALTVKNTPANAGDIRDVGSIPGKTLWRRKYNALQYDCPEYPMDRGAWQAKQSVGREEVGQD